MQMWMPDERVEVALQARWRELLAAAPAPATPFDATAPAISPPFPREWPAPPAGTALDYYGYAHGLAPGHADAMRVTQPWARASVAPGGGDVAVDALTPEVRPAGIQGVRPVGGAEKALFAGHADLAATMRRLAAGGGGEPPAELARYYIAWCRNLGVLSRHIRPYHRAFFHWLGRSALAGADVPRAALVEAAGGRTHELDPAECTFPAGATIGRGERCTVVIADPSLAELHAEVNVIRGEHWLSVLTADRPASRRLLDGDVVRLGKLELRFLRR